MDDWGMYLLKGENKCIKNSDKKDLIESARWYI
jgi:hypothetical protein